MVLKCVVLAGFVTLEIVCSAHIFCSKLCLRKTCYLKRENGIVVIIYVVRFISQGLSALRTILQNCQWQNALYFWESGQCA